MYVHNCFLGGIGGGGGGGGEGLEVFSLHILCLYVNKCIQC
jgi:hypothetical protein